MIPRLKPVLGTRELLALIRPASPSAVPSFEGAFARLMGQKHAVAFPYGRTGLLILLEAMGLKGKEILCPAYTCVVVAHAIVLSGNEPVFIDSQDHDLNMDLERAEKAITRRTGGIIATSIFGCPVDLDRLASIRSRHPHLRVIQDCAHSFAAEWRGRPVQREGDAAVFGLNISKLMTSIFGGMVTTDDDSLAERLRELWKQHSREGGWRKSVARRVYLAAVYPAFWEPVYGFIRALERNGWLDRFVRYYDEGLIDMPWDHRGEMTGIEATIGTIQIERYPDIIAHRRAVAGFYDEQLAGLPGLRLPPRVAGATWSHYVARSEHRDRILRFAHNHGLQLGSLIDYSIPEMTAYRTRLGSRMPCTVAGRASSTAMNLPLWIEAASHGKLIVRIVKEALKICASDGKGPGGTV